MTHYPLTPSSLAITCLLCCKAGRRHRYSCQTKPKRLEKLYIVYHCLQIPLISCVWGSLWSQRLVFCLMFHIYSPEGGNAKRAARYILSFFLSPWAESLPYQAPGLFLRSTSTRRIGVQEAGISRGVLDTDSYAGMVLQ